MDNLVTLCMIGIIVVVGLMLLPRLLGGMGGGGGVPGGGMRGGGFPNLRRGDEQPRYDDPDIQSQGGFGGGNRKRSIFPRMGGTNQSPMKPRSSAPKSSGGSRKYNSPDVGSRGGFGGDK